MAAIAFDTLKCARRLIDAGVPQQQAEAQAEVMAEAVSAARALASSGDTVLLAPATGPKPAWLLPTHLFSALLWLRLLCCCSIRCCPMF